MVKKIKTKTKTKKKQAQRRKEKYHSVEKRKHFLRESDWYWWSSTLASRFRTKESPSNQNLPYIILKTRFPFIYASTRLATNRNFESCLLILFSCSLARSPVFPFLPADFSFGNFAHYCVILLKASLSDRDKKKRVCNGLLFPGNLDPPSLMLGGTVVPLVCSFRRQGNLLAWCELFANLYELKSRI